MSELQLSGAKIWRRIKPAIGSPLSHDVTVYIWNNYWIEPDRLGTIRASRNVELRNVKQHLIKNFFLSDLSKALPKGFYAFVPLQAPA